ncbi:putative NUC153 domain containing protein [Lyophyllum shimeji]|uniref:NUC153 domain containing protein n=1 Tax=Lyophyllum shimeji TaxID=47721 RepID=A0A9P3UIV8_LYOSH|nr:putative NUC153 domain containing protein [Lyophyllum shimeji]
MSDARFARLKTDPRFRRPRKKNTKVVIDDRFKSILSEEKSSRKTGRVDKYGRPISETHEKDNLRRFYHLENGEEDGEQPKSRPDYARGEVLLESSDEEDDDKEAAKSSDENDQRIGHDSTRPIPVPDDPLAEINLDETDFADLDAQAAAYSRANPDVEEPEGIRTNRLAAVNLDWDHVRAIHLFKICSSLVSPTAPAARSSSPTLDDIDKRNSKKGSSSNMVRGKVLSVRIYPSEFGKQRMAREEIEGPPPEIFKKKSDEDEEINAQNIYEVGDEEQYDKDALRNYQLERLRYYYAIITCDTVDAATHIYRELEGTELERSANVFDLSFVPDDTTFDGEFRDEATDDPATAYKAVDFVTDALRHSNVKLTWDEDDPERNQITRRKLTKKEIEDADYRAYLASSSSESESEETPPVLKSAGRDKKASRDKLRALLLGGNDDMPEGWGREESDPGDVDMEITFTPGLSEKKAVEETTLETYQRKMREKRKKRKEEAKDTSQKRDAGGIGEEDDFFDTGKDEEPVDAEPGKGVDKKQRATKAQRPSSEAVTRPVSTPEELALLLASDDPSTQPKHFNLKSVLKAEKKARRKGKKRKDDKPGEDNEAQADFTIDVNDERFKALHEDHNYAIDPTNPHFKKTSSMDAFLKERARRQKQLAGSDSQVALTGEQLGSEPTNLNTLVESVKRKSAGSLTPGTGKRRKV